MRALGVPLVTELHLADLADRAAHEGWQPPAHHARAALARSGTLDSTQ
jgi:hypothetical protein